MAFMKWIKLGKIFDPTAFKLPNDCFEFAQSPQALVFDDFVRIYFSTREKDLKNNKYLSHIAFIDMTKDFKKIINVSKNTVIGLGKLGCFDEHGIFPMNVLRHKDKIYGYTCGWNRRVSVSVDTSIGLAISHDDGLTFQKIGDGPIVSSSLHEPYLVGDPFVAFYDDAFYMWYIFGVNWKKFTEQEAPDRVYKIGQASSLDGINWKKGDGRQIIKDRLNVDESQALPSVVKFDGKYHMFFCYRQSHHFRKEKGRGYRIGYAFSEDLKDWVRDDEHAGIDVSDGAWDSDMMCYPHVFKCDGRICLLYNGNEFGKYGFGMAVLE
jgi:hypothetical protein